jgi:hypothetical protein
MGLRDIETRLPPGFRFYPSDEELVCHYLHNKVTSRRFAGASPAGTMIEVDLHVHEPWELPGLLIGKLAPLLAGQVLRKHLQSSNRNYPPLF